jgi:hypothetical protein
MTDMVMTLDFDQLTSKDPRIKYGFTKELLNIAANNPELLYDHFEHFQKMLRSENNIIKWTAIDIIGYLSAVDVDNKIDNKINDLIRFLHGGKLITCNHAIFALGNIAKSKKKYRRKILRELIEVSNDTFETEECKNIATGKVLDVFKSFPDEVRNNEAAVEFIVKATNNLRNSTKKKANQILLKLEKISKKEKSL